jgi:hypothetical protein
VSSCLAGCLSESACLSFCLCIRSIQQLKRGTILDRCLDWLRMMENRTAARSMKEAAGYCTALHKFLCAHARTAAIGVALLQSGLVELSDVAASQGVVPVGSLSVAAIQVALSTVMGEYDTFYPAAAATSTSRPGQARQRDHESYALLGSPAAHMRPVSDAPAQPVTQMTTATTTWAWRSTCAKLKAQVAGTLSAVALGQAWAHPPCERVHTAVRLYIPCDHRGAVRPPVCCCTTSTFSYLQHTCTCPRSLPCNLPADGAAHA